MPPKQFYSSKKSKSPIFPTSSSLTKFLVIVESPSKCKKIEEFLGNEYTCIASKGHIRNIPDLKAIHPDFSMVHYSISEDKKTYVEQMKQTIKLYDTSNIFVATDDDREGEAIAWHICEVCELSVKTTKRIIFHEITKPAIVNAIQTPTIINMNKVYAQQTRQILDMWVGYKISPFLWKYDKTNGLSAGRCQTPALRLVYDNHILLQQSKSIDIQYKTTATFFSQNIPFVLQHDFREPNEMELFLKKSITHDYFLQPSPICKEITKSPPNPFNTSHLLQVANNILHYSPQETMSLCQELYQNGDITYMRTESTKYSVLFVEEIMEYITKEYDATYHGNIQSLISNEKTNPHEAIRVTHIEKKNT